MEVQTASTDLARAKCYTSRRSRAYLPVSPSYSPTSPSSTPASLSFSAIPEPSDSAKIELHLQGSLPPSPTFQEEPLIMDIDKASPGPVASPLSSRLMSMSTPNNMPQDQQQQPQQQQPQLLFGSSSIKRGGRGGTRGRGRGKGRFGRGGFFGSIESNGGGSAPVAASDINEAQSSRALLRSPQSILESSVFGANTESIKSQSFGLFGSTQNRDFGSQSNSAKSQSTVLFGSPQRNNKSNVFGDFGMAKNTTNSQSSGLFGSALSHPIRSVSHSAVSNTTKPQSGLFGSVQGNKAKKFGGFGVASSSTKAQPLDLYDLPPPPPPPQVANYLSSQLPPPPLPPRSGQLPPPPPPGSSQPPQLSTRKDQPPPPVDNQHLQCIQHPPLPPKLACLSSSLKKKSKVLFYRHIFKIPNPSDFLRDSNYCEFIFYAIL